jgi:hypothetical protein
MKRYGMYLIIASVVFCLNFSACSKAKDEESGKGGAIDKMTDRVAESAVKKIKTPIDKARAIQEKEGERTKAMDEATKEQ